jgi:hypothetical protein
MKLPNNYPLLNKIFPCRHVVKVGGREIKWRAISLAAPQSIWYTATLPEGFFACTSPAVLPDWVVHSARPLGRSYSFQDHCCQPPRCLGKYREIREIAARMRWRGASDSNLSSFCHVFSSLNKASTSAGDFFNCCCNYNQKRQSDLRYLFECRLHHRCCEFPSEG